MTPQSGPFSFLLREGSACGAALLLNVFRERTKIEGHHINHGIKTCILLSANANTNVLCLLVTLVLMRPSNKPQGSKNSNPKMDHDGGNI